jgi:serine/threonine protein kinase
MDTTPLCPSCGKSLAADAPQGLCQECLLKAGFPTGTDFGGKSSRFVPPKVEELAGRFPQLEILQFIGQGGMGAVYKARQKQLNRLVALKILPPGVGSDPAFAGRFTREAQALAQLNHPGIVTLYEFGQVDGLFYFLMEFVDGVNLRQLLRVGRVSAHEALAIVPQICDALQFAHDQGIVHRDIKPENVLLDRRGRVKVADFGLAKLVGAEKEPVEEGASHSSSVLTEAGKIMGTPSYMAPEQVAQPTEADHRADIYALGVVFYQMLTGELPGRKIEPPSRKVQIDVRLDEVVLRALEKEPERRYQQVSEVGAEIENISITSATQASNSKNRKSMNSKNLKSLTYGLIIGAVCVVIGLLVWLTVAHPHDKPASATPGLVSANPNPEAGKTAMQAVQAWLELVDNGDYGKSWEVAADSFHAAVSQAEWESKSQEIRQPLGNVLSRKLNSSEQPTELPGMPDGTYFVAKFDTAFANLKPAVETVTFALGGDGQWKAISYLILPGGATASQAATGADNAETVASAQKWLAGIDDGRYDQSWTDASEYFRDAITQAKWTAALDSVRAPLGSLVSRAIKSTQLMTEMPGAPDGRYAVMQFATSFSNMKSAIETVTFMQEKDGSWKSIGYYIK